MTSFFTINNLISNFFLANEAKLPKLTKQQLTKLKQLSIVSMAAENRVRIISHNKTQITSLTFVVRLFPTKLWKRKSILATCESSKIWLLTVYIKVLSLAVSIKAEDNWRYGVDQRVANRITNALNIRSNTLLVAISDLVKLTACWLLSRTGKCQHLPPKTCDHIWLHEE